MAMAMVRRQMAVLMAAACVWWVAGCGGGSTPSVDTSNTEATVKGTVRIDGKPATEGEISFDPSNYQRKNAELHTAQIGKDGTYTVKTLTGENTIRLGGTLVGKSQVLSQQTRSLNVQPGDNTFDFEASTK